MRYPFFRTYATHKFRGGAKVLKDINIDTLEAAIRYGLAAQNEKGKLMK